MQPGTTQWLMIHVQRSYEGYTLFADQFFVQCFFYTKSVLYSHKYIFFYCGNQLCYFTLYVHATFVTKWTLSYSWIKELYIVWRVDRGCGAFANFSTSS